MLIGVFFILLFVGCSQTLEETSGGSSSPSLDAIYNKCMEAEDESKKQQCIKNVACIEENPDVCGLPKNQIDKDECFLDLASCLNNSALCEKITSKEIKDRCLN